MLIRCIHCFTPFTMTEEAMYAALDEVEAKGYKHYNAYCPRCGRPNMVARAQLEREAPGWTPRQPAGATTPAPGAMPPMRPAPVTTPPAAPQPASSPTTAAKVGAASAAKPRSAAKPKAAPRKAAAKKPAAKKAAAKKPTKAKTTKAKSIAKKKAGAKKKK